MRWPAAIERSHRDESRSPSKFKVRYEQTKRELTHTLEETMDVDEWYLDEETAGSNPEPGIVVFWRKGPDEFVVGSEAYRTRAANLREAYLWIEETRKREQRLVDTAHESFAAAKLPPGDPESGQQAELGAVEPHQVLDLPRSASREDVRRQVRLLSAQYHPDSGEDPDEEMFKRVQKAGDRMLDRLKNQP